VRGSKITTIALYLHIYKITCYSRSRSDVGGKTMTRKRIHRKSVRRRMREQRRSVRRTRPRKGRRSSWKRRSERMEVYNVTLEMKN